MKDNEIDDLFAALDVACSPLGYERFDEAARAYLALAEKMIPLMTALKDRDELRRKLRVLGEVSVSDKGASAFFPPEYQELKPVFAMLFSSVFGDAASDQPKDFQELLMKLPYVVHQIRPGLISAAKQLPHPLGGRPRSEVQKKQEEVCREIAALYIKRVPLKAAYARVAQRHGVSATTIERIWRTRKADSSPEGHVGSSSQARH